MPKLIFPATLVVALCISCTPERFDGFDLSESGGQRITLAFSCDTFLIQTLDGYTDPGLRKVLENLAEQRFENPEIYYNNLVTNAESANYRITHYFHHARPDLFPDDITVSGIASLLISLYDQALTDQMLQLHQLLEYNRVVHNLYRSDASQLVLELKNRSDRPYVDKLLQLEKSTFLQAREITQLNNYFNILRTIDSLYAIENDQPTQLYYLFGSRLALPVANHTPGFVMPEIDQQAYTAGLVLTEDTAQVGTVIRRHTEWFPGLTYAWARQYKVLDSTRFDFLLVFCTEPDPEEAIRVAHVRDVNLIRFYDGADIGVQMHLTDEGSKRWHRFISKRIGHSFALFIEGELMTALVPDKPVYGVCELRRQFTQQEAEHLSIRIKYAANPNTLAIVLEETISPESGL